MRHLPCFLAFLLLCTGCASYDKREVVDSHRTASNPAAQAPANLSSSSPNGSARVLKQKVAVARFTNEARSMSPSLFGEVYNRPELGSARQTGG
jgi:uncharacterized protein YcfL